MKNLHYYLSIVFVIVAFSTKAQNIYLYCPPYTNNSNPASKYHSNEIIITSIQGGIVSEIASGPNPTSRPVISEYTLTKTFDKSSIDLMQMTTNGTIKDIVEIRYYAVRGSKEEVILKIELASVFISSFSASSGDGMENYGCINCPAISESLSLHFAKYRITDMTVGPNKVFQWDLVNGTPTF